AVRRQPAQLHPDDCPLRTPRRRAGRDVGAETAIRGGRGRPAPVLVTAIGPGPRLPPAAPRLDGPGTRGGGPDAAGVHRRAHQLGRAEPDRAADAGAAVWEV